MPGSDPLGSRSVRVATKRATRLAATQLDSSSARLDNDTVGLSFGEPSRRKAHVKVTYGGKKAQRYHAKRRRSLNSLGYTGSESDIDDSSRKPALSPFSSSPSIIQSIPSKPTSGRNPRTRSGPVFLSSRSRTDTAPSIPISKRSQSLSSLSSISDDTADHCPGWEIEDHHLAFVHIDREGNISEDSAAVWWPAEVFYAV
jgi:hypothetical protein